jgi:hypothetical protein
MTRDQHQTEGLHDADNGLMRADETIQPVIGRGFEQQYSQHAGRAGEVECQPQGAYSAGQSHFKTRPGVW